MVDSGIMNGPHAVLFGPPAAIIGIGERIIQGGAQNRLSPTHVDLVVVAHQSKGTVRQVRVFPDGRVETKAWNSWAQMQAPENWQ